MTTVDGNGLAGVLDEVVGPDPTVVLLRCSGCGSTGVLARVRVHTSAMGSVARCRDCDVVLVTVVDTPDGRLVSLPGARLVGNPHA